MTSAQEIPTEDTDRRMSLVQTLAADLGGGKVELPSFPDVVIRIRQALADENVSVEQVARLVGTEPALAARLLKLANSSALNPGGRAVTDLKTAITRMGANLVRTSAIAFAMSQIQHAPEFRAIAAQLAKQWEAAMRVAAVTHAVAKRVPRSNAEEAMLAGLLHSIGKTYILTRFARSKMLDGDAELLAEVMESWYAAVGQAILQNWSLPGEIAAAVGRQDEFGHGDKPSAGDLAHLLATGKMLADYLDFPAGVEIVAAQSTWQSRLGLDAASCVRLLEESRDEIGELRRALAG